MCVLIGISSACRKFALLCRLSYAQVIRKAVGTACLTAFLTAVLCFRFYKKEGILYRLGGGGYQRFVKVLAA